MIVVLVDDEDTFRTALAETLRDDGHEVIEYKAANDAAALQQDEVEVLITDYEMPAVDGLAFADRFHTSHPTVPVVLITAFPTANLVTHATARHYLRLLRKPLDYNDLRSVLSDLP